MRLHFNDPALLTCAKTPDAQIMFVFGTQHTLVLDCEAGRDSQPVDMSALGCVRWAIVLTAGFGDSLELYSQKYDSSVCDGSTLTFDLQILTGGAYRYLQGNPKAPALLCIKGWDNATDDSRVKVNIQLPVFLQSNETIDPRYDSVAAIEAANEAAASASAAAADAHTAGVAMDYAQSARDDAERSAQRAEAAIADASAQADRAEAAVADAQNSATAAAASEVLAADSAQAANNAASNAATDANTVAGYV